MGRQRHTAEQIIAKLREAEVMLGKGMPMEEVLRQLAISDATYYKWRKECGGLRVDQAKRLKELEQENSRLRKVVSDVLIDNQPRDTKFTGKILKITVDVKEMGAGEKAATNKAGAEAARKIEEAK